MRATSSRQRCGGCAEVKLRPLAVLAVLAPLAAPAGGAAELSGYLSFEPRVFFDAPLRPTQPDAGLSPAAVAAPEWRFDAGDGTNRFTLAPYFRVDADDDERTHADLREAVWLRIGDTWVSRVGVGRVFWGVTESRHLVDVINQTDLVEDFDEEDKLGQPMLNLERWVGPGSLGVFVLPGFRERTFPERTARLSGAVPVAADAVGYESGAGSRRTDLAVRWYGALGGWDIGVSAFHGTSREPRLLPGLDSDGEWRLAPYYDVIGQVGLDVQYTRGAWLWKLEALGRRGHGSDFGAAVAGFEYTAFGIGGSGADLGLLAEYLYDGRGPGAPPTLYDDDWFGGVRLALNDAAGTAILGGVIVDGNTVLGILEGERRLTGTWKLEAEVRWFRGSDADDPLLAGFRRDSFATLRLAWYF